MLAWPSRSETTFAWMDRPAWSREKWAVVTAQLFPGAHCRAQMTVECLAGPVWLTAPAGNH